MIIQSDAAIAAWRATERTLDAKVTITDSSGNETDYATSDITSIAYDSGAWTGDTFSIGSTYENNITVTFAHLVEGLEQGYKVTAKIGIKLPDETYEYVSLGVFIISDDIEMDRNNDITTIKCYDQFSLMEGTYTSSLTYPAKLTDVIAEIANNAGVELNTDEIAELPTQSDLSSEISSQTYRVAIGWIAQFYGGFAMFDRNGKLTIRTTTSPNYILDASQYEQSGLTKNEATYKIGGMSVSVTTSTTDSTGESSETTSTLTTGETTGSQIELTNNVMTQTRLDNIWSTIKNITFYPFDLTWFGNPAIEAGDWLTLKDTKDNSFNVPNNSYTMTFDGGLTATSKADQTSTSSSSYSYSGTLSQTVKELAGRIGATGNYIYGEDVTEEPTGAKINDEWYKQNGNKIELWRYVKQSDGTGKWTLIVSDLTGVEISQQVTTAQQDAITATTAANTAVDTANMSLTTATNAVVTAQTASDTATAVQEQVTTLKGGSAITLAELENGLATKISSDEFTSYKTQTDNALINKVSSTDFASYQTQTDSAIQQRVTSDTFNAETTTLSNMINSKVTAGGDVTNICLNPYFSDGSTTGWSGIAGVSTGNGSSPTKYYAGQVQRDAYYGDWFNVVKGDVYYIQGFAWTDNSTNLFNIGLTFTDSSGTNTQIWRAPIKFAVVAASSSSTKTGSIAIPDGYDKAKIWTQIDATSNFGEWWFTNIYVGRTAPAGEMYSQMQQLSNNINLRVQKNDVINQINISTESILIAGSKVHITGTTTIDDAVITSAMISSLSASKLTAGTIDASTITVINLDADNITSGTISGTNLSLNLGTGEVSFQKGSIKSSSGTIDLEIADGTLSVTNSSGDGVFFKSGTMSLTSEALFDSSGSVKYGKIALDTNILAQSKNGMHITGTNGVHIDTLNSTWDGLGVASMLAANKVGSSIGISTDGRILIGGNNIIQILGGASYGSMNVLPALYVGSDSSGTESIGKGKNIFAAADNIYFNTNSNVSVTGGGFIATAGGSHIQNTRIDNELWVNGNFSVSGTKNAVVETTAGWVNINAYETAEYYFGDIGFANTSSGSKVKITFDSLFLETINTAVDYHVFISSYGNGYAWCSERGADYFVIESNVPNLDISYEVKAKRKGYENDRLEINTAMENTGAAA
ncbi:gp58-like family protein [Ligilactobacillus sp. WILCCON 0076]|uniref:Gp58-like family protein n=1 Tax=Ligilactobacillus ubinensis TaxID=2876789 RepID=A0A9X2FMD0_9LACO|nr:gp58-like family protein [Ligilactobacillus ubinensis]MCP0886923.1 gp58-like family protein [Ligilactobacillus ubinensis]